MATIKNTRYRFDPDNVYTAVNAELAPLHGYGFFANTIAELMDAVVSGHNTLRTFYGRLWGADKPERERRFVSEVGNFSLYYFVNMQDIINLC